MRYNVNREKNPDEGRNRDMIWVCTKCGHEMESEKHPDLCPMCYAPMHHMIPKKGQEEKKDEKKEKK